MAITKQEKMFHLIEERIKLGCTIKHICKKYNISPLCYGYWQQKYKKFHNSVSEFISVQLPESKIHSSCIKIVYPNNVSVEIENCDNIQLVKQLINIC